MDQWLPLQRLDVQVLTGAYARPAGPVTRPQAFATPPGTTPSRSPGLAS